MEKEVENCHRLWAPVSTATAGTSDTAPRRPTTPPSPWSPERSLPKPSSSPGRQPSSPSATTPAPWMTKASSSASARRTRPRRRKRRRRTRRTRRIKERMTSRGDRETLKQSQLTNIPISYKKKNQKSKAKTEGIALHVHRHCTRAKPSLDPNPLLSQCEHAKQMFLAFSHHLTFNAWPVKVQYQWKKITDVLTVGPNSNRNIIQ